MLRGLAIVLALLALPAMPCAAQNPARPLEGAFIHYDWHGTPPERRVWERMLSAMKDAGLGLVIIQRLEHNGERYYIKGDDDPTTVILDYAAANGMEVFVGMRSLGESWEPERFAADEAWVKREQAASLELMDVIAARYASHRAFTGWYLTHEIGNESDWYKVPDRLRDFFSALRHRAKKKTPDKPVASSPYFNPSDDFMPAAAFAAAYAGVARGARIDIVMLQDGVGERCIPPDEIVTRTEPFFRALGRLAESGGFELWGNVENFNRRCPANEWEPGEFSRLRQQIGAVSPWVRRIVTYNFNQFMDPGSGGAAKKLYDEYRRAYPQRQPERSR